MFHCFLGSLAASACVCAHVPAPRFTEQCSSSMQWKPFPVPSCSIITHQFVGDKVSCTDNILQAPTFDPVLEAGQASCTTGGEWPISPPEARADMLGARGPASCDPTHRHRELGPEVLWGLGGLGHPRPICPTTFIQVTLGLLYPGTLLRQQAYPGALI